MSNRTASGLPTQPARYGDSGHGSGFSEDAVQFIAFDPAGGDKERAWRIKDLRDFAGAALFTPYKVTVTQAAIQAAWSGTPGAPVLLPDPLVTLLAGQLLYATGVIAIGDTPFDDSAAPGFALWEAPGGASNVSTKESFDAAPHTVGSLGNLRPAVSGSNIIGSYSRMFEPLYAVNDTPIYPGVDGWNGDGTPGAGEVLLWCVTLDLR